MEASQAMAEGLRQSGLECSITQFPIADGGNDTMELLTNLMGGTFIQTRVHNPLGEPIICRYGWVPHRKTGIIGVSEASGIHLLQRNNVMHANTFGTGQQVSDALEHGATTIIIGVGGSATTDGGCGILRALGIKFYDAEQKEITHLPKGLLSLKYIDDNGLNQQANACRFIVLCDVDNHLLGKNGAAQIYAPQKGATQEEVQNLEKCLKNWNRNTLAHRDIDMSKLKYGGAAGGVSAGLHAWLHAQLINGTDYFLDAFNFDRLIKKANYIFTGEGQIDYQTLKGKGPLGVALRAKEAGIPVVAFCGTARDKENLAGFDEIIEINRSTDIVREMKHTKENLVSAVKLWAENLVNNRG